VTGAECSGCPTTVTTAQNEERARKPILQNRSVMVDEVAKNIRLSALGLPIL
jgi:hypothetical protein